MHGAINRQVLGLALLALLASVAGFALKAAVLTGEAAGMTDPDMLGLLWQTPAGTALVLQVAGLSLVIGGVYVPGIGLFVSAGGGGLALWSFGQAGHIQEAEPFWLGFLLMIHLAVAAFWIGILSPLQTLAGNRGSLPRAAELGHHFGRVAIYAVPLLIVAGIVMAWNLLGSLSALVSTGYGLALLSKVGALGVLLGAAAVNKLHFIPGMSKGDRVAAAGLRRSIAVEWGAVCCILAATAVLTTVAAIP